VCGAEACIFSQKGLAGLCRPRLPAVRAGSEAGKEQTDRVLKHCASVRYLSRGTATSMQVVPVDGGWMDGLQTTL
jgi:hypothetical protein